MDIKDFKWFWLVLEALEHYNEEKKKVIGCEHKKLVIPWLHFCNYIAQTLQKYC